MKVVGNLDGRVTTMMRGRHQGWEDCSDDRGSATMMRG